MNHLKSIISKNSREYDSWAHCPSLNYPTNKSIIYVIDSGINLQHPELANSNITLLNNVNGAKDHGTRLTSLISGKSHGVSPDATVKFIGLKDEFSLKEVFEDILEDRKQNNSKLGIVLCAFQITNETVLPDIKETYDNIKKQNSIVVTSCGNSGKDAKWHFPATDEDSLVVGSHDINGLISMFNSISANRLPDVFAPGRKIKCLDDNKCTGSSYSAAIVAAALSYYADENDPLQAFKDNLNVEVLCWKYPEFKHNQTRACFIGTHTTINLPLSIPVNETGTIETDPVTNKSELHQSFNFNKPPSLLKDSCVDTINNINYDNIIVPMSGGIDSEIVAISCIESNKSFTPLIMRYVDDNSTVLNDYDFIHAEEFCKKHNLTPKFLDCNIIDFYESGLYYKYAKDYYVSSPQLCVHLWMMDQVDGFFIFPGDPIQVQNNTITTQPFMYYCYDYYFYKNKRDGIARLLTHTNAIMHSSICIQEDNIFNVSKYDTKVNFYKLGGYNITKRDKKYTGFEHVKKHYDDKYYVLRYYDARFRSLLCEMVPSEFVFFYNIEACDKG